MKPQAAAWLLLTAGLALGQPAPAPPASIAKLAADAAQARDAGRLDEALVLYNRAVAAAPKWAEGWWQIGTIEYGLDRYPQCRNAFRRFAALEAKISAGFAFLGLCEFQTKEFAPALEHLETAAALGLPNGEQLADVAVYHLALLHTKGGNFERALQFSSMLARKAQVNPNIIAVAGIAALRRAVFPHEVPENERELVLKIGDVLMTGAGRPADETIKRFEEIANQFPDTPNVHYTFSTLLLPNDPDRAVAELKRELEVSRDHLPSLVSLGFEYLKRGEPAAARPYAERAAKVAPDNFAARACLGRVLLESGDSELPAAVRELEAALRLAPDSPQVHFSLATAYSRAGRKQDAARHRAEFGRLKKLAAANPSIEVK